LCDERSKHLISRPHRHLAKQAKQPDAGREPVAAKKKRSKISAKAATAAIEARIGHKFADSSLLATGPSRNVSRAEIPRANVANSYQRMEFLGDHVLGLIVSDMLYRAFLECR